MKNTIKALIAVLAITAVTTINGYADSGVGTDSLNFLKIEPSARGASLGAGFVAVSNDVNAVVYNPAGLSQLTVPEISLTQLMYVGNISYEYGAFASPITENITLGAYVIYMNYGSIDRTSEDNSGIYTGTNGSYTPNDLAMALSGAYKLSTSSSLGLNLKYATENIDTVSISGVMADVGAMTNIDGTTVGAAVYNLGTVNQDKAPMGVRAGVSTKFKAMEEDDLLAVGGVSYTLAGSKVDGAIGGEWSFQEFLQLRGSYSLGMDAESLNLGMGIKQKFDGFSAELGYNFSLMGDLGAAHRVSLLVKLGDDEKKSRKKQVNTQNKSTTRPALKYYFKKN